MERALLMEVGLTGVVARGWASVPRDVRERVRLGWIEEAGRVLAAAPGEPPPGRGGPAAHRLARLGRRSGAWPGGGRVVAAPAAPAVLAAWALAPGRSLGEALAATLSGWELAGRLGLAALFREEADPPWLEAAAVAAAAAHLGGREGAAALRAVAGAALAAPARGSLLPSWSAAARGRARAAALAGALDAGEACPGALEELLEAAARPVLGGALAGAPGTWLARGWAAGGPPSAPPLRMAVEALAEILDRHLRAADKRLRVDQVERVDVALPFPPPRARGPCPDRLPWDGPSLLGGLVADHELSVAALPDVEWGERWDRWMAVARRVRLRREPVLARRALAARERALAPLVAGLPPALRDVGWRRLGLLAPGERGPRRRPGGDAGRLGELRPDEVREVAPVEVVVHTTRGGAWPERRELPEGAPGWPWDATRERVLRLAAGGDPARRARHEAFLAADPADPADAWVEELLR